MVHYFKFTDFPYTFNILNFLYFLTQTVCKHPLKPLKMKPILLTSSSILRSNESKTEPKVDFYISSSKVKEPACNFPPLLKIKYAPATPKATFKATFFLATASDSA